MNPRIPKVNQLLQEELGEILLRELDLPDGVLVTITRVDASGNLQEARVYISVMPEARSEEVMLGLERDIFSIQQALNKRLRMRPVPRIKWTVETKTSEAQRIEELLEKTKEEK
ncbi:MAG: 30S ribosome-binding factor RbfA [bacterium]|nr:30S ribosome-binding factor RbfA [bacterium]